MEDLERTLSAVERWASRLIDTSRRNPLLYFRETKTTALLIPDRGVGDAVLAGERIRPSDLEGLVSYKDEPRPIEQIQALFKGLQRNALLDREEKGIETLTLGIGFATWEAPDDGRNPNAPVILLPVELRNTSGTLELRANGDPRVNPVLVHILAVDLGVELDLEALDEMLAGPDGETEAHGTAADREESESPVDRVFQEITQRCSRVRGFRIGKEGGLGRFRYQRMAMVADLEANAEAIAGHTVAQALAGGAGARQALSADGDASGVPLDEIPPAEEFLVLDADASQRSAIRRILRGESGVIHGPPGTGKSQTIANLLAECAAAGKRVLFVAEKKAAIDAVLKRLEEVGLEHIVLDLHSAGLKRKAVAERLGATLAWIGDSRPMDVGSVHSKYERARERLVSNTRRVHDIRPETGEALFTMWGRLLEIDPSARTNLRLPSATLDSLGTDLPEDAERILEEAARAPALFLRDPKHPWGLSDADSAPAVEEALELATEAATALPELLDAVEQAAAALELPAPPSLAEGLDLAFHLAVVSEVGTHYRRIPDRRTLARAAEALAPSEGGGAAALWAWVSSGDFREMRGALLGLRSARESSAVLLAEARALLDSVSELEALGAGEIPSDWPLRVSRERLREMVEQMRRTLERLGRSPRDLPLSEAAPWLRQVLEARRDGALVPGTRALESEFTGLGLESLLRNLRDEPCPPHLWAERFRYVWLQSHLDRIEIREPELASFRGRSHDDSVREFRTWDRRRTKLARDRVRHEVAVRAVEAMEAHPQEAHVVRRESRKRSRHIPIRRLFQEAGEVLTRIVPCWVASPLSVSELLDSAAERFDLVVFDEGSQVPTEDAVPALYRGRQLVVAGDPEQLPPTSFFDSDSADDDDGDEVAEDLEGFESVLDVAMTFLPPFHLKWHYRSEDERLIAFSNYHIYDSSLITLPSANGEERIVLDVVGRKQGGTGQTTSPSLEVSRVVELALRHAETRPSETLGIITFGDRHRRRVEAALDDALLECPDRVRDFFAFDRAERAFVKNLETVQGDERDAIILSVGYGWDSKGNLPHRFGPLTQDVGYRRLNVAVTRSRKRMTVVSSFRGEDVDLNRSNSRGVRLLKEFLVYAGTGGTRLREDPLASQVPLNAFERDIKVALERRGMQLVGQYGVSRYRLDLVVLHPDRPGLPVLAIECDGASYHSSPAARDRDRIRQEQLQRLGWRFHRIWSTDWFYRREEEIERAVHAYTEALEAVGAGGAPESMGGAGGAPEAMGTDGVVEGMGGRENGEVVARGEDPAMADDEWEPEPLVGPRPPRPSLRGYGNITDIPRAKLVQLAKAILADGRPRTLDDLVEDMFQATPFSRRGSRIMATLSEAAEAARRSAAGAGTDDRR